jgi:hypothetical protein
MVGFTPKIGDMFIWCLREHLQKMWQTFACVGDPSKKPINDNTIIPQDFQRGDLKTNMG